MGELVIEEKSYLLLFDFCVFIIFVFTLSPYGPEYGLTSHLDAATRKSSPAYFARFTVNVALLLIYLFLDFVLPQNMGHHKILIYMGAFNWIRLIVNTFKTLSAHAMNGRLSIEIGEEIEAS